MSAPHPNLDRAAALIAAPSLYLSDEVVDASKKCLLDWFGVSLGARDEAAGAAVRRTVRRLAGHGGRDDVVRRPHGPGTRGAGPTARSRTASTSTTRTRRRSRT